MLYFDLAAGIVFAVLAVIFLLVSIEEPGCLVLFAVCGIASGFLLSAGVGDLAHNLQLEHEAIYQAARRQGYPVRDSDVHAGYGALLDLRAGRCVFTLRAVKVGGVWRFGVPESGRDSTGGIVFLSPADVAKLAEVCP